MPSEGHNQISNWFASRGWKSFPFQQQLWDAYLSGKSGMLYSSTGSGKTYAALMGPLIEFINDGEIGNGGTIIWITPLRALTNDIAESIRQPIHELGLPFEVDVRTGDTSAHRKKKQLAKLPSILVTTPESLNLLLSYEQSCKSLKSLKMVVVDEWHELIGSKRGIQTELALSRLRSWCPDLKIWGLSATLGNPNQAMDCLLGQPTKSNQKKNRLLIKHKDELNLDIVSIIPKKIELFPWAGHLNTVLLKDVVETIHNYNSTLLFTNTRSQAEAWYQAIINFDESLIGLIALHHGSLEHEKRQWVETAIKSGDLKCVIATSSLDLGVDFSPVDHVVQLGSPKGISRLLQRAGRSGHKPGEKSTVTFVPTNCLELIELSAAREAILKDQLEARSPVNKPLDVLVQHLVTIATGGGFESNKLYKEVKSTYSYSSLTEKEWQWCIDFVENGGNCLKGYPEYRKIENEEGKYKVSGRSIAIRHRMSIGTITSDSAMNVKFVKGPKIGIVEEAFISRLRPGDKFTFGGRALELVRVRDMTAYVRRAKSNKASPVRWMGGKMPLSSELSKGVRRCLTRASKEKYPDEEMKAIKPILELQALWSKIPVEDELLVEQVQTLDGHHLFFFPFEGRLVHEGLSSLIAYRISKLSPITFTISINDYGFELLSVDKVDLDEELVRTLVDNKNLQEDIVNSMNATQMARRHFREIARVAGLVFQGYPGSGKSTKQIQASSELFFDVFKEHDPDNLLLKQADREILASQLEESRLKNVLDRLSETDISIMGLDKPSPLSFPLLVDRLRQKVSSEKLSDRIARMQLGMEKYANKLQKRYGASTHARRIQSQR